MSNKSSSFSGFKKIGSIQDFNDYELFVDEKKWRISKMILRQNHEPKKIVGKFFYARKAGKWVVEETLSGFKINAFMVRPFLMGYQVWFSLGTWPVDTLASSLKEFDRYEIKIVDGHGFKAKKYFFL